MPVNLRRRVKLALRLLVQGPAEPDLNRTLGPEDIVELTTVFPMPKFFVFGHARSGTTLLARLLRVHPEVHCNWQGHFFTRAPFVTSLLSDPDTLEWLRRRNNRWNQGRDPSLALLRAAVDFLLEREARQVGKRVVGDKSPSDIPGEQSVRRMNMLYPDGRLIAIVRDGRDAVLSHLFQAFVDDQATLSRAERQTRQALLRDPSCFLERRRSLFDPKALARRARAWAANVDGTQGTAGDLLADRFRQIRYEDLLADPPDVLQDLWSFLGVAAPYPGMGEAISGELASNPDAEWQGKQEPALAELVSKGRRGGWRQWLTRDDQAIFLHAAGPTLQRLGYETSIDG